MPGVGRQLRAADALSGAGIEGADVGLTMLSDLTERLDRSLPAGTGRIELVGEVRALLEDSQSELDQLELGPDGPLVPPLADARLRAERGLEDLDEFLQRAERISYAIESLLDDGDYLVLAANNAEMRAGSGMFLNAGMLEAANGVIDVGDLRSTSELTLPGSAVDAGSPTYDDLWGFLEPTVEWRNLAASPRFDVTAELATRMWESQGNPRPQGVLAIDPFAVEAILAVTGPVDVGDRTIDADEVVDFLLNEQYDILGDLDSYEEYLESQETRGEVLSELVEASIAALSDGSVDPVELLEGLRDAVRGRHILAWSADDQVQAGWEAAEMAGELDVDSIMVSLLNRGVNKLDPFIDVEVEIDFQVSGDGDLRGVMDVAVANEVPDGEVPYVAGPVLEAENVEAYGDYAGILSVALPGVARDARIEGRSSLEVAQPDGPFLTLATKFSVAQGAEQQFRITFDLVGDPETVRIEPDARPEPVEWRVGDDRWDDGHHHRVEVDP
ncbi:MAG: DUF4012 domain-containing protein [Acidimicrobiales bacterium]|nr:DUF4012 domain-containing protein [Acidimicrobiales bacterium]